MTREEAKAARRGYTRAYYTTNRDKVRATQRDHEAAYREDKREYDRAYYAANAEKIRARRAAYYAANAEKIRARTAAYRHKKV
jgi:hypothetical protein